jgi:hypothetical protein
LILTRRFGVGFFCYKYPMRYHEILEAVAAKAPPAILFHGTKLSDLKSIIEGDTLRVSRPGRDTGVSGVSLTELPKIAAEFAQRNAAYSGPVVLALSTERLLAAGYDIQAFAKAYKREREWRVFGDIHPLSPMIEAVYARLDPKMGVNPIAAAARLRQVAKMRSREGKWSVPIEQTMAEADFIEAFASKFHDLNALLK